MMELHKLGTGRRRVGTFMHGRAENEILWKLELLLEREKEIWKVCEKITLLVRSTRIIFPTSKHIKTSNHKVGIGSGIAAVGCRRKVGFRIAFARHLTSADERQA